LGYRVEACNMYADDCPPFAVTISTDTLVARMKKLGDYLKSLADEDTEDGEKKAEPKPPKSMPPRNRIVIIDEAALAMSTAASDPARRAALQALAESRHLSWHVIYIGQLAGQLPTGLLGQAVVWIKEPGGREFQTDRQNNPAVRDLWTRATAAFDGLREYPFYKEPWLNRKCWAYCDCPSLNGVAGYTGLLPFLPWTPGEEVPDDDGETEVEEVPV
jgi:hypothetical protein